MLISFEECVNVYIYIYMYIYDVGMVFGLDKCAVLVLKRGKMVQTEGI